MAVIAEVEEEWVIPIDTRMEAAGGVVFRRARTEFADARFAADVTAIKGEVAELEREYTHATGAARERLTATIATTTASLDAARNRAKSRFDELEAEAAGKIRALEQQLAKAKGDVKATLDERIKRVRAAYRERSARLKRAWEVAKEAVAA